MEPFIPILIFVTILLLTESSYRLYRDRQLRATSRVRERLKTVMDDREGLPDEATGLLRLRFKDELPRLQQVLAKHKLFESIENFLLRADSGWTIGRYVLISLLLGAAGFTGAYVIARVVAHGVAGGAFALCLPTLLLVRNKAKREQAFHEQLPDLLDLMSRALRAGHSLPSAIQFAGQESPEPIGPEFRRVFDEVNFGMDVPAALENLSGRMDCPDLRYLTTAVAIQRETGGNLSELFDRLAHLIRERFKLIGQTRALTAQGRFSGYILTALPLVMAGLLYLVQPDYLKILVTHPFGPYVLGATVGLQVTGYLLIRKIVNIETL